MSSINNNYIKPIIYDLSTPESKVKLKQEAQEAQEAQKAEAKEALQNMIAGVCDRKCTQR